MIFPPRLTRLILSTEDFEVVTSLGAQRFQLQFVVDSPIACFVYKVLVTGR